MEKKWLFCLILAMLGISSMVYFAGPAIATQFHINDSLTQYNVNISSPVNGTEFYSLDFNVTYWLSNVSSLADAWGSNYSAQYGIYNYTGSLTGLIPMSNTSSNWLYNTTGAGIGLKFPCYDFTTHEPCWRNFTIVINDTGKCEQDTVTESCPDDGPTGNLTWLNTTRYMNQSSAHGWVVFRINERPEGGVTITFANNSFINNTMYQELPPIIFRTNESITNCSYTIGVKNDTTFQEGPRHETYTWVNFSLSNITNQSTFRNSSSLRTDWNNTFFNETYNITIRCQDVFGNNSWLNTSANSAYTFWIDHEKPNITKSYNFTYTNNTQNLWLNVTFNITDNSTMRSTGEGSYTNVSCLGRVHRVVDNAIINMTASFLGGNRVEPSMTCSFNLFGENITGGLGTGDSFYDGEIVLEPYGFDQAGNIGVNDAGSNDTMLLTYLTAGWNMVTFSEKNATTLRNLLSKFPNASAIAMFDNNASMKNYTTYTAGAPTINNKTEIYPGNATWIYVNSSTYYLRGDYLGFGSPNVSGISATTSMGNQADHNVTLTGGRLNYNLTNATALYYNKTSWNVYAPLQNLTANLTLHICTGGGGDCGVESRMNLTMLSWYNATAENYITCVRNMTYCAGGTNDTSVTNFVIKKGWAIWLLATNDGGPLTTSGISINRSIYNSSYTQGKLTVP